jgi:hypothetical protein
VLNETQTKTTLNLELGTIGEDKLFLLEEDYNSIAIPQYNEPLKVSASVVNFNKATYSTFTNANNKKEIPLKVEYVDSLESKPKFLKLELLDRVAVLNALNSAFNEDVKAYIFNKKDAHMVWTISIVLKDEKRIAIMNSDALFLEQDGAKKYILKAYKNGDLTTSLTFSDGVVFAYQASNFCWQESDKHQIEIVDIVESSDKCPNDTYRSAKRAKKDVDYFKF